MFINRNGILWIITLSMLMAPGLSAAGSLTVISVNTPNKPLTNNIVAAFSELKSRARTELPPMPPVSGVFPMRSTLTPGAVAERAISDLGMKKPVVVAGSDPQSMQWLLRNKPYLESASAVLFLVNATDLNDIRRVKQITNLQIVPVIEPPYLNELNIRHYPVLLTNSRVEQ